ncbi:MAG: hypothetical protein VW338_03455 [Rhodospirillaceae bacterium]
MPGKVDIEIDIQGVQAAINKLDATAGSIDRISAKQKRIGEAKAQLNRFAREEQRNAFNLLTNEQKIERLMQRRDRLQRVINKARGDELRLAQLNLAVAQNEAAIAALRRTASVMGKIQGFANLIPGGSFFLELLKKIGVQGLITAGVLAGFYRQVRKAQALDDLARTTQLTVERLQALKVAAKATGVEFETITRGIQNTTKTIADALRGEQMMIDAFKELGVTMDDLRSKTPEEVFLQISRGLADGSVSAQEFNALLRVMEEEARHLLPAFTKGLGEIADQAEESGAILSKAMNDKLAGIGDFWDRQFATMGQSVSTFFSKAAFMATQFGDTLTQGAIAPLALFSEHWRDVLAEMQATRLLEDDSDYQEGLARVEKMKKELETRQNAKRNEQDARDKATEENQERTNEKAGQMQELDQELKRQQFAALDTEQKRKALVEEIKRIEQEIAIIREENEDGGLDVELKRKQVEKGEAEARLKGLTNAGGSSPGSTADQLARIGLFRGGQEDGTARRLDQILNQIQRTEGAMNEIRAGVRKIAL